MLLLMLLLWSSPWHLSAIAPLSGTAPRTPLLVAWRSPANDCKFDHVVRLPMLGKGQWAVLVLGLEQYVGAVLCLNTLGCRDFESHTRREIAAMHVAVLQWRRMMRRWWWAPSDLAPVFLVLVRLQQRGDVGANRVHLLLGILVRSWGSRCHLRRRWVCHVQRSNACARELFVTVATRKIATWTQCSLTRKSFGPILKNLTAQYWATGVYTVGKTSMAFIPPRGSRPVNTGSYEFAGRYLFV